MKAATDELRGRGKHVLFLHGGDMVQGTLYFTKYAGRADVAFMNLIGFDSMCIGNHEFDRGPELLAELAEQVNFPLVSANVDVSGEPKLAGKVTPSS
ncbi:MAG TPA: metallophosphoesterase [Dissulfurispiraceae bacterium]|nr:metallophosphoesterase [Dissulfurispiraceae bacterium]